MRRHSPAPPSSPQEHQQAPLNQDLQIESILESRTNPRRTFPPEAQQDLVESVKSLGVLEPLVVRRHKTASGCFEIVAGARRYRAARVAGLQTVPCRILELTDDQVLEIQLVENIQRQNLHPLEEAQGYRGLMAAPYRMSALTIARKIGKSEKYVHDRIKTLQLAPELREVFRAGEISTEHAIRLARIPAEKQLACLGTEQSSPLFATERVPPDPEDPTGPTGRKCISVRELQAWIDQHVRFGLQPDPLDHPETARALQQAQQEDARVLPITYEHRVQDDVRDGTRIFGPRSWRRADGTHDSKTCERSELGLVVAGPHRGEAFLVCRDTLQCLVHFGREIRARRKAEHQRASSEPGQAAKQEQARVAKGQAKREREQRARDQWRAASHEILRGIDRQIRELPTQADGFLAKTLMRFIREWTATESLKPINLPGTDSDAVVRRAAYLVISEVALGYDGPAEFPPMAKAMGVDLKKILREYAPTPEQSQTSAPATRGRA